jgi:hypothetical protein
VLGTGQYLLQRVKGKRDLDFPRQAAHGCFRKLLNYNHCRFLTRDSFIWVPVGEPGFPSLKI